MKLTKGIFGLLFKLYIGLIFFFTLLLFYIPINILKTNKKTKKHTFIFFVIWSWVFRFLCFIQVKFIKKEKLPQAPYIIIANHASYLDIFLMYSILPKKRFLFLGKSEILHYPLMKSFFKNLNIPVFRGTRKAAQSFIEAKKEIKNGWSLVIFPEGGIPDDNNPKMIPFKDGAFKLAKNLQVPIIPITFLNNHLLFSDPTHILGPARPGFSKVIIHEYIHKNQINELSENELKDLTFDIINKPIKENYPNL